MHRATRPELKAKIAKSSKKMHEITKKSPRKLNANIKRKISTIATKRRAGPKNQSPKFPKLTPIILKKLSPLTTPKRRGSAAVDSKGRFLPVDYESAELHDPYDPYYHDTSQIFDEHPHLDLGLKVRFPTHIDLINARKGQQQSILVQIDEVRSKITDPKELSAFNNVLIKALNPEDNFLNAAEVQHEMEKLGIRNASITIHPIETSWRQFLTNDFVGNRVTSSERMSSIANYVAMLGSAAFLGYIGIDACVQYYYDLEHPLNHH